MGIVAQCRADVADALHDGILGDKEIRPDCVDQFVLGNETPGVLGEIAQDIEGLGPKLNLIVPAHQRAGLQIKRVLVEAKPCRVWCYLE